MKITVVAAAWMTVLDDYHVEFSRDIEVKAIPREGESIAICDCCDPAIVERVLHCYLTDSIEIRLKPELCKTRAEVDAFREHTGKLEPRWALSVVEDSQHENDRSTE